MLLRCVVRELEAWLLADRRGIADHLGVALAGVARDVERLEDPKRTLVALAQRSRRRRLRDLLVPPKGTTATQGRGYTGELARLVAERWDVGAARRLAPSLDGCVRALERLAGRLP